MDKVYIIWWLYGLAHIVLLLYERLEESEARTDDVVKSMKDYEDQNRPVSESTQDPWMQDEGDTIKPTLATPDAGLLPV